MTIQQIKIINDLIDAWESLKGNKNYDPDIIQDWLLCDMKPNMDKIRIMMNRKILKK